MIIITGIIAAIVLSFAKQFLEKRGLLKPGHGCQTPTRIRACPPFDSMRLMSSKPTIRLIPAVDPDPVKTTLVPEWAAVIRAISRRAASRISVI